jgi:hypothetical protein
MGAAAAMGTAVTPPGMSAGAWRATFVALAALIVLGVAPRAAHAQQRFALIISGATGGASYIEQYGQWSETLRNALLERMKLDPRRIAVLSEAAEGEQASSAANVRRAFTQLRREMERDDLLMIVLLGHGTFDGVDAKFNLVGPDLGSAEWSALLRGIPGRLVIVNTTAASFPFIERLSGPGRVVITATDSVAQKYDTVFPEHFIAAFGDDAADIDKNGRVSIWEAFSAAAAGVRRHYQQRGQLSTEQPLLDDNGDGVGRGAAGQGEDGSLASRTYLDVPAPGAPPTDEVLLQLMQQRGALEAEVEELQIKKAFMQPAEYAREFERLMIALARVSRDIRARNAKSLIPYPPPSRAGFSGALRRALAVACGVES